MTGASVALRRAGDDRLPYVRALLERNGLPTGDLGSSPASLYVAYDGADGADGPDGSDPVGVGGLEIHGPDGLLRSVAVEERARGRGIGTALCGTLEERAAADGAGTLYLLTTTAAGFFAGRGYAAVERGTVPPAIRGTTEFADLCPETATVMRKRL